MTVITEAVEEMFIRRAALRHLCFRCPHREDDMCRYLERVNGHGDCIVFRRSAQLDEVFSNSGIDFESWWRGEI